MTKIKQGYITWKRQTKIRLFVSSFQWVHSRLTRTITQQRIRVLGSAHRDRDKKKTKNSFVNYSNKYNSSWKGGIL